MQNNQAIFESLFKRNFSNPENTNILKEITATHPYFSPAQFYLLQQTDASAEAYNKQAAKTAILFNNPLWLNFQLQQTQQHIQSIEEYIDESELEIEEITESEMEEEIEPMKIELKLPEINAAMDEKMLFEPMHMVDYFASQGIKLTEEVQTADKLGKQLKSFTEWLKTMKKVHIETETDTTVQTDATIQNLAEKSNAEGEVLTESMAEVFAKQGKVGKASEVYQKLSLLNPAKSAYFAAKIENLKGL